MDVTTKLCTVIDKREHNMTSKACSLSNEGGTVLTKACVIPAAFIVYFHVLVALTPKRLNPQRHIRPLQFKMSPKIFL